ncbi:hypothetical protein SU69_09005 [Thermosipho melanesiensis]|uniref:DUF4911 domain-containing protein n=2 Tax=Thermosipho melanesiensis TaxID=46541 RepID=A6LNW7_THEM4|nr:DUF4911 domain-containing protein [Thermosipho melanesiensis]ABR31618.1 hypothetical protein Tmel_1783 [Thermosipho melanesiensis BI429]APT74647.1 hypothetical protein BW47_09385 [Thermosipho melanesiensis]OOC35146.1 hypothetical protein SU69_09005 [Thermosipho melanesiensis]OOC35356.1 hypothetical protein SU70_09015 [Thermosipho melanesiensis]OOC36607.1 hypothetical protein SU68_09075 [Thermosipho melanesiensis]
MEIDILVKINKDDVHYLSYILESQDNMVNVRKYEGNILRIITLDYFKDDVLSILRGLKNDISFEVIKIEKNCGSAG